MAFPFPHPGRAWRKPQREHSTHTPFSRGNLRCPCSGLAHPPPSLLSSGPGVGVGGEGSPSDSCGSLVCSRASHLSHDGHDSLDHPSLWSATRGRWDGRTRRGAQHWVSVVPAHPSSHDPAPPPCGPAWNSPLRPEPSSPVSPRISGSCPGRAVLSLLSPCHSHTYSHQTPYSSWGDGKGDDRVTGGGSTGQTPDKRHPRPASFQTRAASNGGVVGQSDLSRMEAAAAPRGQQVPEAWSCQPHRGLEGQGPQGRPAAVVLAKHPKVEGHPSRDRHVRQPCAQSQGSVRRALGCDWHLVP